MTKGQLQTGHKSLREWKIDNHDLSALRPSTLSVDRPKFLPHRIKPAPHISERDFLTQSFAAHGAGNPTGIFLFARRSHQIHTRRKRHVFDRNQSAESLVPLARHLHARNNFLSNVTALLVIDCSLL